MRSRRELAYRSPETTKHEIRVDLSLGSQPRVTIEEGDDRERSQHRVGCIGSGRRRALKGKRARAGFSQGLCQGERDLWIVREVPAGNQRAISLIKI
jgi:hypothetical protein